MAFFLDSPGLELAQGDVVRVCVYGSLPPTEVVRRWENKPNNATLYPHPPTDPPARPLKYPLFSRENEYEEVAFHAFEGQCLVLSNTCVAIDKADNQASRLKLTETQKAAPFHVAPLRPWPSQGEVVPTPTGDRQLGELIQAGLVKRYWAIERHVNAEGRQVVPRCYVDLRFLTPLKPTALRIDERIASLSDESRAELQAKLFVFFSGKALPERVKCQHCGQSTEVEPEAVV